MTDMATRERLRCCTAVCSLVLLTAVVLDGMVLTAGPAAAAVPVQQAEGADPEGGTDAGDSDGPDVLPAAGAVAGAGLVTGLVAGGALILVRRRKGRDDVASPPGELPSGARAVPLQIAAPGVPEPAGPEPAVPAGSPVPEPPAPEPDREDDEDDAGVGAVDPVLAAALGALRVAGRAAGLPSVNRLEVTPDTVDVVLADPAPPPAGFTAAGANRWRTVRRSERPGEGGEVAHPAVPALPVAALVPVGLSGRDTEVLVDLEASGLVVVDGPPSDVAALLRGLVAALLSTPGPARPHLLLVGMAGTIVDRAGVGAVDTLAEALDRAEAHADHIRHALGGTGAASLGEARVSGAGGEAWTPLVVVSAEQPTDGDVRRRLRDLALRRNSGVAFVTPPAASGILPGRRLSLRDDRLLVDGFDEVVRPRMVSEEDAGGMVSIDVDARLGALRPDDRQHSAPGPVLAPDGPAGPDAGVPTPLAGLPVKVPENAAPTLDQPTPPALLGPSEVAHGVDPVETRADLDPASEDPVGDGAEVLDLVEPVRGVTTGDGEAKPVDPVVDLPVLEMEAPDSGPAAVAVPPERDPEPEAEPEPTGSGVGRSSQVFAARGAGPSDPVGRRFSGRGGGVREVEDLPGPATKPVPVVMFDTHDDGPLPPPPPEPAPSPSPDLPADVSVRSPFAPPTPGGAGVPAAGRRAFGGAGPDGRGGELPRDVAVLVRVLGHVEAARVAPDGLHEEPLTPPRPKALEAVVYLALRENGADREALEIRLFPDGANVPKTMYNTISAARALLGEHHFPPPMAGRYRLDDGVATDYGLFRELVARADVTDDPAEVAPALTNGLLLVRGEPFMGPGRNYAWAGPHRNMIVADVVDAAERLAEIRMAQELWPDAEWAARQGLRAFPQNERLYRLLMRSAAGTGNRDAVYRVYNELCTLLREPGEELDPDAVLHPETLSLMAELTAGAS